MSRPRSALPPSSNGSLAARIRARAHELGFQAVGFAPATPPPEAHFERFQAFLRRGMHGEMAYLARHEAARRRVDGPEILAGAATVISVARRYGRAPEDERADPPLARLMARYARGEDYHDFLVAALRRLARFVASLAPGARARATCDTAPVLERAWATRAGLGAVGKNGNLIVPGQGSYVLLGEVITTLPIDAAAAELAEPCGECTLCLEACPAGAFVAPYVLDPRRCISYATIESSADPPPDVAAALGDHLFGCDRCQEICPHNRVAPPAATALAPFLPLSRWQGWSPEALLGLDEGGWRKLSRGSALGRLGHRQMIRTAKLVLAARSRGASGVE